jgi:DNA-binding IclR family transcriptional regulator
MPLVKTLEFMGYLRPARGANYTLGPAALRIGSSPSGAGATQAEPPGLPHAGAA